MTTTTCDQCDGQGFIALAFGIKTCPTCKGERPISAKILYSSASNSTTYTVTESDEAWTPDLDRIRREGRSIAEVID